MRNILKPWWLWMRVQVLDCIRGFCHLIINRTGFLNVLLELYQNDSICLVHESTTNSCRRFLPGKDCGILAPMFYIRVVVRVLPQSLRLVFCTDCGFLQSSHRQTLSLEQNRVYWAVLVQLITSLVSLHVTGAVGVAGIWLVRLGWPGCCTLT